MTPERQRWWDSLPEKHKYLRREIACLKYERSAEKCRASITRSSIVRKTALEHVNCCTAHIRALNHELNSTTVAMYVGHCVGYREWSLATYRCEKCGGTFEDFGQRYCCWCGRKIVGCK